MVKIDRFQLNLLELKYTICPVAEILAFSFQLNLLELKLQQLTRLASVLRLPIEPTGIEICTKRYKIQFSTPSN